MIPVRYAVYAAPPIQALMAREPDIVRYVSAFCSDEAPTPYVDVVGPPTQEDIINRHLPMIRLHMRKYRHHLTDEPTVEVACTDEDHRALARWNLIAEKPAVRRIQ